MSINFGGRAMQAAAACIWLAAGCSKRNPDLCCDNDAECTAVGFSSVQPCDLGVCVNYACTTEPGACDDDHDCAGTVSGTGASTPVCVVNTCAVCSTSASCPATAPICDDASHDCRTCAKDAECASGACDLAGGTCIDPVNILYASPTGSTADACTASQPCALAKASSLIDGTHLYLVLSEGTYPSGPFFSGQKAIVCGHNATIMGIGKFAIQSNSDIEIRYLQFTQETSQNIIESRGSTSAIEISDSKLLVDHINISTIANPSFLSIRGDEDITIRDSTFTHGGFEVGGQLTIARSTFKGAALKYVEGDGATIDINSSLFVSDDTPLNITIHPVSTIQKNISLINNTFIDTTIDCGDVGTSKLWASNIFYNVTGLPQSGQCTYYRNLITPTATVSGSANIFEDPQFVDPHGDFHLKPTSPAIDAADPLRSATVGTDHDNVPRPQGNGFDLGAFEAPAR